MIPRTLILSVLLAPAAVLSAADTRVWTNSGVSTLWSDTANWSNGVPADGDAVLLLRHPLGFTVNAVNDLTNLTVPTLRCEALGYNLSGGSLRLTDQVLMGGPLAGAFMNISAPLEIPGPNFSIVSTNGSQLTLSGLVNAPAGAIVTIDGGISFRANPASDYRAETRLRSGAVPLLFTRISGPLVVGGSTDLATLVLQSGNLFGDFPSLTILTNGTVFNISTFNSIGTLNLNGGTLNLGSASPNGRIAVNGDALLQGGATLLVSSSGSGSGELSVTGRVTLAGCSLKISPNSSTLTTSRIVLRNDSNDPIQGTFTDLPEGGILTNGLVRYAVSYAGGDGNDVTLTPIIEPARLGSVTRLGSGEGQFLVQGQPGFTYITEATPHLSPPIPWQPIGTNGTDPLGTYLFTDLSATNFELRFFRVRTK